MARDPDGRPYCCGLRQYGLRYGADAVSLVDVMFNRATGHVVAGDRTRPTQATELWTFRRDDRTRADGWQLSAIQQAAWPGRATGFVLNTLCRLSGQGGS